MPTDDKQQQIAKETAKRMTYEMKHHNGHMPDEVHAVWHGYIAALLEWDVISPDGYAQLFGLLRPPQENPGLEDALRGIFLGRDSVDE